MILYVRCRYHASRQFAYVQCPANFIECAVVAQLVGNGNHVYRALVGRKVGDSLIYFLVVGVVETFWFQNVTNPRVGVGFEHDGTQYGLFYVGILRGKFPQLRHLGHIVGFLFGITF